MEGSRRSQVKTNQASSEIKKNSKNFMWNDEKSAYLVQCLVNEAAKGMKVDKSFKRQAFVAAAKAVSEKFGEACHWTKVENHLKTLKKQWGIIMNLKGLSGSNFDPVNKIITLGDGSYQDFVKAHPKEAMYLNVPIKFYDEYAIICGDDQATGEFALDDLNEANLEDICENDEDVDDMDHNEVEDAHEVSRGSHVRNTRRVQRPHQGETQSTSEGTTSGSRSEGRKRKIDKDLQSLVGKLEQIADNMIDAKTRHKRELLAAIKSFTDFPEDVLLSAYEHCLKHETEADLFLARSSQSRKDWLYNFII